MSWNFAGIHFKKNYKGAYPDLLKELELGDVKTAENLTFSRALDLIGEGTAVGVVLDVTVLLNELLPYDCSLEPGEEGWLDDVLRPLSEEGDIFNYIVDGRSGTYGFSLFSGGRRVRRWGAEPGNILVSEGSAVEGEGTAGSGGAGLFKMGVDEARVMGVWEAFTGLSFQALLDDGSGRFEFYG